LAGALQPPQAKMGVNDPVLDGKGIPLSLRNFTDDL
jgi:hypothetical protein